MSYCWEYTNEFLNYRQSLGYDIKNANYFVNNFSKYLKDNCPKEEIITKEMTLPYCTQKESEKTCSFRTRIYMIKQFTLFCSAMGYSDFVLNTDFLPKNIRYTPYIFSDKELINLFNYLIKQSNDDSHNLKKKILSIIYRLIFFCGLRPNEGREIKIEDIDLIKGTLYIKKNKAHKERIIAFSDDVLSMMKEYCIYRSNCLINSDYLFPNKKGDCYNRKWLTDEFLKAWNAIKDPTNNSRVRVYDLRHRYATTLMLNLIEKGKDLYTILPYMSAYMGHENFNETAYYIHLLPKNLLESKVIDWKKMSSTIPEVTHE